MKHHGSIGPKDAALHNIRADSRDELIQRLRISAAQGIGTTPGEAFEQIR